MVLMSPLLAKKGDLTKCGNWKGITPMSVVAKVMGRVLIRKRAAGVDAKLRKEQAGFRKGTEHDIEKIFVLRNILEQANRMELQLIHMIC